MGIRSERRLCEEVHFNRAYHWFCRPEKQNGRMSSQYSEFNVRF
ncbi:transposase [Agrobacterium vitis]|uniref:Transposase n=1 Tax=Agrobacterium vitis TaxID=373 RepID=A0A368NZ93_AGRVI|nr:transposase [Agrobacterium vitis]KAA3531928.1 transposase [Agrobacterium vitis]RCU55055.1 transposase [Agrobacterium vitis]